MRSACSTCRARPASWLAGTNAARRRTGTLGWPCRARPSQAARQEHTGRIRPTNHAAQAGCGGGRMPLALLGGPAPATLRSGCRAVSRVGAARWSRVCIRRCALADGTNRAGQSGCSPQGSRRRRLGTRTGLPERSQPLERGGVRTPGVRTPGSGGCCCVRPLLATPVGVEVRCRRLQMAVVHASTVEAPVLRRGNVCL